MTKQMRAEEKTIRPYSKLQALGICSISLKGDKEARFSLLKLRKKLESLSRHELNQSDSYTKRRLKVLKLKEAIQRGVLKLKGLRGSEGYRRWSCNQDIHAYRFSKYHYQISASASEL